MAWTDGRGGEGPSTKRPNTKRPKGTWKGKEEGGLGVGRVNRLLDLRKVLQRGKDPGSPNRRGSTPSPLTSYPGPRSLRGPDRDLVSYETDGGTPSMPLDVLTPGTRLSP